MTAQIIINVLKMFENTNDARVHPCCYGAVAKRIIKIEKEKKRKKTKQ